MPKQPGPIARRASALAPNLALGHGALSDALWGQLDFRAGLAEYGRALDLSPDDVDVLMGYESSSPHRSAKGGAQSPQPAKQQTSTR